MRHFTNQVWALLLCCLCLFPAACQSVQATDQAALAADAEAPLAKKQAELAVAQRELEQNPNSEEKLIWYARRLAYLERYDDAQQAYSRGLVTHPDSWRILRHRGHRWITLRQFERAVDDLERAWQLCKDLPDEVEPDGQPNAAGIPIGSYHSNVIYHLALARYLLGEWNAANEVWERGRASRSTNDDRLCSSAYWQQLALTRAGRAEEARAVLETTRKPMHVIENESYLLLCQLFYGDKSADDVLRDIKPGTTEFATRGYGVACWKRQGGDRQGADDLLAQIVATGPRNAFGAIAAEADLKRGER